MQRKRQNWDNSIFSSNNSEICPRCGELMVEIQTCHFLCENCGAQVDCSDL